MKQFPSTQSDLLQRLRHYVLSRKAQAAPVDDQVWFDFDRLYRRALLGFARRRGLPIAECHTLTNDLLVVLCNKILEYDRSRGRFHHWLCGIASNLAKALNERRSLNGQRERRLPATWLARGGRRERSLPSPLDELLARERAEVVGAAIAKLQSQLSERDYRLFLTVWIDGKSRKDAAGGLKMTAPAARQALGRAQNKLVVILRREGFDQL